VSDNSTNTYEALRQRRDAYKNACETVHKENKARLFDFLESKSDIQSIHVEFNGSGDSGQIEDIRFMPEGSDIPLVDKTLGIAVISHGSSLTVNHKMLSLRDCIEQLCYDFFRRKRSWMGSSMRVLLASSCLMLNSAALPSIIISVLRTLFTVNTVFKIVRLVHVYTLRAFTCARLLNERTIKWHIPIIMLCLPSKNGAGRLTIIYPSIPGLTPRKPFWPIFVIVPCATMLDKHFHVRDHLRHHHYLVIRPHHSHSLGRRTARARGSAHHPFLC